MANKVMNKVSKKTFGKKVDTVADYVDIVSQMIAEYFNRRYKIEQRVEDIRRATLRTLYQLKKEFVKSIVEAIFLTTGLLALIVGTVLLLSHYIAIEYILIFYGLVVTILVLLRIKVDV
mgnify:CR=1 FL=1